MANYRPEYDADRSLILQLALGYFTAPDADAQLKKVYDRSFAPLATEYEEAIAAHRTLQSEVNTGHQNSVTSDGLIDETQRLITLDVEARHGKAGLKELERLCGGRTRSEVTGLNIGETPNRRRIGVLHRRKPQTGSTSVRSSLWSVR